MKKLLITSIVMLATMTACQNSNDEITSNPIQKQTSIAKTTAREGDVSDEKEAMLQAIEIIKKDVEVGGGSDSRINCHTSYFNSIGHACVSIGGYLFNVSWHPTYQDNDGNVGIPVDDDFNPLIYDANQVSSCNCR